jgi:hypothetical protein|tara:strand:- start:188 stop:433 length:246 start_codon:yes stop_codon:yes gene_type:complete
MNKSKKNYKPHMMYCKDGSSKKAKTYKEHLALKKKGCGHSPMKMDPKKGETESGGKGKPDPNIKPVQNTGKNPKKPLSKTK